MVTVVLKHPPGEANGAVLPRGHAQSVSGGVRQVQLDSSTGDTLVVELEGNEPEWLAPVLERMATLLRLPEDWDSYGAVAIDPRTVAAALDLLSSILRDSVPAPVIVPTKAGGIQLEWNLRDIGLEINLARPDELDVYFEDYRTGHISELVLHADVRSLRPFLDSLSRST